MPNYPIHYRTAGTKMSVCGLTVTTLVNTTRSGTKITCCKCHKLLFKKPMKEQKTMVKTNTISVVFTKEELDKIVDIMNDGERLCLDDDPYIPIADTVKSVRSKAQLALLQLRKKNGE